MFSPSPPIEDCTRRCRPSRGCQTIGVRCGGDARLSSRGWSAQGRGARLAREVAHLCWDMEGALRRCFTPPWAAAFKSATRRGTPTRLGVGHVGVRVHATATNASLPGRETCRAERGLAARRSSRRDSPRRSPAGTGRSTVGGPGVAASRAASAHPAAWRSGRTGLHRTARGTPVRTSRGRRRAWCPRLPCVSC